MVTLTTRGEKFADFCAVHGNTYDQLVKMMARNNLCPGIWTNVGCHFTCEEIETDQAEGRCEVCGNRTIVSLLLLAG